MTCRLSRTLILACVGLVLGAGAGFAQTDQGKRKLPKLFTGAVSAAAESTVRIQCDGKDAALGTVVSADGLILTKGSELRGAITARFFDGTLYDARQIGYDKTSDLALLKVEAEGLRPVKFATPTNEMVGNWVAVTGPTSEPIAVGVVSSGVRKLSGEEVRIENSNKGYMGIRLADPEDQEGVLVMLVEPAGSAAKAGMKKGDIIYEVAGKPIKNRDELVEQMEGYKPGDSINIRVHRGDEEVTLRMKLGSRSDFSRGDFQNAMGGTLSGRRTGFPAVLQHDTVIRPSDCGGPLVDLDGRVLGINIARAGRVETWALPGDLIEPILKELKSTKATPVSK